MIKGTSHDIYRGNRVQCCLVVRPLPPPVSRTAVFPKRPIGAGAQENAQTCALVADRRPAVPFHTPTWAPAIPEAPACACQMSFPRPPNAGWRWGEPQRCGETPPHFSGVDTTVYFGLVKHFNMCSIFQSIFPLHALKTIFSFAVCLTVVSRRPGFSGCVFMGLIGTFPSAAFPTWWRQEPGSLPLATLIRGPMMAARLSLGGGSSC